MPNIYSGATPSQVAADLAPLLDFQPDGLPLADLERLLHDRLMPHLIRYDQPQFQSMFNAYPSAEASYGAQIALETNQGVTNWQVSPGGAMLEDLCGRALCQLFGLGISADATFMYAGTYANQQALYLALHRFAERQGFNLAEKGIAGFEQPEKLRCLVSADAHFSIKQACRMLGLGEQAIHSLPLDDNRRIDIAKTESIISSLAEDHHIFCIIATTGTTSTGSIDPVEPLLPLRDQLGAWLHVDGAYGFAYQLVPEYAPLFTGVAQADSITWDPHKQLGVPIPNSLLFVKDGGDFGRMSINAGYFNRAEDSEPNPGLKSPPTTRPFSALPLVTALRGRGLTQTIADLRQPLVAMRHLYAYLAQHPRFQPCHQPDTGILCLQHIPATPLDDAELSAHHRRLYEMTMASGQRTISTTSLNGQTVLRLVSVSPTTHVHHLKETVDFVDTIAAT